MQQPHGQLSAAPPSAVPAASGASAGTNMPSIPAASGGNISLLTATASPPRPQVLDASSVPSFSPVRTLDFGHAAGPPGTPLGGGHTGFSHPMPAAQATMLLASPGRRASGALSRSSSAVKKHCNCKNSRCLKLYCECFASGRYCDGCNCVNCCNNRGHEATRQAAVEAILERNPNAFRPKIQANDEAATRHNKGCNCKKSGCLKKYCECFQAGVFCSDNCKCIDCKNFEGSDVRELMVSGTHEEARRASLAASPPQAKRPRLLGPAAPQAPTPAGVPVAARPLPAPMPSPAAPSGTHIREAVREVMQRGIVDEMARLLVLVSREEGDKFRRAQELGAAPSGLPAAAPADAGTVTETAAAANGGAAGSTAAAADREDAAQDSQAAQATDQLPPDSQGATAPPGQKQLGALHEAQERAVLTEFNAWLGKVLDRVRKRASDMAAAAAAAAVAAAAARPTPILGSRPAGGTPASTSRPLLAASQPAGVSMPVSAPHARPPAELQRRLSGPPPASSVALPLPASSAPAAGPSPAAVLQPQPLSVLSAVPIPTPTSGASAAAAAPGSQQLNV